jgi:oligopeptide/dipeptide ABC transporter ATP-binding protein
VHALDDVSFDVAPGEIVAVIGESGAGKSTLGMSIIRLIAADASLSGQVIFGDRDLVAATREELRSIRGREIAVVLQDPAAALNPVISIGRQIDEILAAHTPLSRAARRERVIEVLTEVGIPAPAVRYDNYPHEFSGGMQQRVTIAMALACTPKLIVADEPTSALDVTTQARLLRLFARIAREHSIAIVLVTHDPEVARSIADRVVVLYAGTVLEAGTALDVLDHPRHPYTRALLTARPTIDSGRDVVLKTIPGRAPDLRERVSACAFYERCPMRVDPRCAVERPPLRDVGNGHLVASFYDLVDEQ